jgi:hypothetical protein
MAGSRATATRVTFGAICLSTSSHFAPRVFRRCNAGDVATRPGQTIDEARANRIGDAREHDRHGACRTLQLPDCATARCEDHVRRERDQFKRVFASVILIACGPAIVDLNVFTDGPTELLQPLQKCGVADLRWRIVCGQRKEHAYAPHPLALLRARSKRPNGRCAAEKRDQLASCAHSMTWSSRLRCHAAAVEVGATGFGPKR